MANKLILVPDVDANESWGWCREKILSRAENLREAHVEVQLFNLTSAEKDFSMDFWKQLVSNPDDDLGGQTADAAPLRLEVPLLQFRKIKLIPLQTDGTACLAGSQD